MILGEMVVDLISSDFVNSLDQADRFNRYLGGSVINVGLNLHRLGYAVDLAACVGEDGFGKYLRGQLEITGISQDLIQATDQAPTTLIPVARSSGTPDFLIYRGADHHLRLTDQLQDAANQAQILHTSAFALSRDPARNTIHQIMKSASADGKTISLDPNYHTSHRHDIPDFLTTLEDIYQSVTITKPSLDDSRRIFGKGLEPDQYLERFLDLGPQVVVLTMGEDGSLIGLSNGDRYQLQPKPVEVVDVTGAGDAFWSGLLVGLHEDLSVVDAARLGQAVAETKIRQLGPILDHRSIKEYRQLADKIVVTSKQ